MLIDFYRPSRLFFYIDFGEWVDGGRYDSEEKILDYANKFYSKFSYQIKRAEEPEFSKSLDIPVDRNDILTDSDFANLRGDVSVSGQKVNIIILHKVTLQFLKGVYIENLSNPSLEKFQK